MKIAQLTTPIQLNIGGATIPVPVGAQSNFKSLGEIVSRLLQYALPLGGLILFVMIIISGFQLLTSAGEPKKMEQAKQRLTWGILGFMVIFVAFWIMRIMEFLLGIQIL